MEEVLRLKYSQCTPFRLALNRHARAGRTFHEATLHPFWGTGVKLKDVNSTQGAEVKGQGKDKLGELLGKIANG